MPEEGAILPDSGNLLPQASSLFAPAQTDGNEGAELSGQQSESLATVLPTIEANSAASDDGLADPAQIAVPVTRAWVKFRYE